MTGRAALLAVLAWSLLTTSVAHAGLTRAEMDEVAATPRLGAQLPLASRFPTRAGTSVSLGEAIDGRAALLVFADLTCDTLCGVSLRGLADALSGLDLEAGRDYALVVASIDPKDGPEQAKRMAADQLGEGSGALPATFLLGDGVAPLARAAGFSYRYDAEHDAFAHPVGAFVLRPDGKIARFLSGTGFAPIDLRLALTEARGGEEAPIADRLLLMCYRYDPVTGTYTSLVRGALAVSGLTTVAVLALGVGLLLMRERRARRTSAGGGA